MGLWIDFEGYLEFNKPMNSSLKAKVNDYIDNESWMDPHQPYGTKCPWHIDEYDRLVPQPVKYYDHEVWLQYLIREFLRPEGYDVSGLLVYNFEGSENEKEIYVWDSWFFTKQLTVRGDVSYEEVKHAYEVMNEAAIDLDYLSKSLLTWFVMEPEDVISVLNEKLDGIGRKIENV